MVAQFDPAIDPVNEYNIGLGRLLRFLQLATSLRLQDIAIRKQDREDRRAVREQKIIERDQREGQFGIDEQEYINSLEQGVAYDPEEFKAIWTEKNPEIEIPPEVQDEDDLDVIEDTN